VNIGHLDFANVRCAFLDQLNQVPLADLGMVDVQHQPQMRIVNGSDQRERVGSLCERGTGMINSGV
jgi:hypothetical protein